MLATAAGQGFGMGIVPDERGGLPRIFFYLVQMAHDKQTYRGSAPGSLMFLGIPNVTAINRPSSSNSGPLEVAGIDAARCHQNLPAAEPQRNSILVQAEFESGRGKAVVKAYGSRISRPLPHAGDLPQPLCIVQITIRPLGCPMATQSLPGGGVWLASEMTGQWRGGRFVEFPAKPGRSTRVGLINPGGSRRRLRRHDPVLQMPQDHLDDARPRLNVDRRLGYDVLIRDHPACCVDKEAAAERITGLDKHNGRSGSCIDGRRRAALTSSFAFGTAAIQRHRPHERAIQLRFNDASRRRRS